MGKVYAGLDQRLTQFILAQPVFFVATAPSGDGGHVNVSPKGYRDTFAILGLGQWTGRKSAGQLADYRAEKNAVSIDGLPAIG